MSAELSSTRGPWQWLVGYLLTTHVQMPILGSSYVEWGLGLGLCLGLGLVLGLDWRYFWQDWHYVFYID